MARLSVKQTDFSQGLTITGSFVVSGSSTVIGNQIFSGSINIPSGSAITGSLFGTASFANNSLTASNALTASYISASNVDGLVLSQITSGSYTASIGNNGFQVKDPEIEALVLT